jgi:hypothetical protein
MKISDGSIEEAEYSTNSMNRLGLDSRISRRPANLASIGTRTPKRQLFKTMLHTVPIPTAPSGMTKSPKRWPGYAAKRRSPAQRPESKAFSIALITSDKRSNGNKVVLMGTKPFPLHVSNVVW